MTLKFDDEDKPALARFDEIYRAVLEDESIPDDKLDDAFQAALIAEIHTNPAMHRFCAKAWFKRHAGGGGDDDIGVGRA